METKIIYLDVETGGLLIHHSLFEIAMHTEVDGKLCSWSAKIKSDELCIDPSALAYSQMDLRGMVDWPEKGEVLADITEKFIEWDICTTDGEMNYELVACGFNVRFDVDRVNKFMNENMFSHRVLDLTSIAIFHGIPCDSFSLIRRYGDENLTAHSAYDDALNAYYVHKGMTEEFNGHQFGG